MGKLVDLSPWLAFETIVFTYLIVLKAILLDREIHTAHKKLQIFIAVVGLSSIGIAVIAAVLSGTGHIMFITPEQSIAVGTGIAGLCILLAVAVRRRPVKN